MVTWLDRFTGQVYQLSEGQHTAIRNAVARALTVELRRHSTPQARANAAAAWWQTHYYERVFPLRFGREPQGMFSRGVLLGYTGAAGTLRPPDAAEWRTEFLDGERFPPILPAETQPDPQQPYLLAGDHHLATAALLNVCLRRAGVDVDTVHQARLGALLHELIDMPEVRDALQNTAIAYDLARYLKGETTNCPEPLQPHQVMINAVHCGQTSQTLEGYPFCIVGLAAQRIKQYVFETLGLPEIRGASLILDAVVSEAAKEIANTIGQECVLQQVASTLIFLAPEPADWTQRLKRRFYEATQVGFCAAGYAEVSLQEYFTTSHHGACMTRLLRALDNDRYRAEQPEWECLPFETRCTFCRKRAATTFVRTPDGASVPICPACEVKRKKGDADERREAGEKVLRDAGIADWKRLVSGNPFAGGPTKWFPTREKLSSKSRSPLSMATEATSGRLRKISTRWR